MSHGHDYSESQIEFLRANCTLSRKELTQAFNEKFSLNLSEMAIKGTCSRNKIYTGRTGRFPKGSSSWNTGKTGYMGANVTSFRKGNIPRNHKPVGHERITVNGFVEVKTQEPNVFELKSRLVYQQNFGAIPEGMIVKFVDGNTMNFDPSNLTLMSRSELLALNRFYKHKESDPTIKPVLITAAKLKSKIFKTEKQPSPHK